jgi:hypothetical protein
MMDDLAGGLTRAPAPAPVDAVSARPSRLKWVANLLAHEPFLVLLVAVEAVILCFRLPAFVNSDTWLSIVAGRLVAEDGLPHHETLTVWAHGKTWIDQQWLGQLALYGLHAGGGLRLVLLVHVVLLLTAFTLALVFARRSGGSARSVALVGIVALVVALPNSVARTQTFAFLFFVLLFWLLASEARTASRRVLLALPLLLLWANVHGSVVLGVALVGVWALAELFRAGRRRDAWPQRLRAVGIAAAGALCLLVSPYGLSVVDYYRSVLGSNTFHDLVTEWQATTFPTQWPFYLLALGGIWVVARKPRRVSLFEHLALILTLVAAFDAIRNLAWFALVAVMVVPRALDDVWPQGDAPVRRRVNVIVGSFGLVVIAGSLAIAAGRPATWYVHDYPNDAAQAVGAAAAGDPSARVFANERFADWLLWKVPQLKGRVAFDARFELLTPAQLRSVARLRQRIPSQGLAPAGGYRILVLDPLDERGALRLAQLENGTHALYRDPNVYVMLRAPNR